MKLEKMQMHLNYLFERDNFPHQFEPKERDSKEVSGFSLFGMDMSDPNSSDQDEEPRGSKKLTYTCAFPGCDGVFNSTSNKKRHEKLHSGEKPHKCDFPSCGKSFARKYDLKVHVRTHTKEKPYNCEVMGCGKKFSRNSSLREHERNIHNMAVGQKFRTREIKKQIYSFEPKPRERSESKRYEKDSKTYLPLDGQSKAQVQELVNLFRASQGDCKSSGIPEVRSILPRELVTSLLDIKRERVSTKNSDMVSMLEDSSTLPPLHHLYSSYPATESSGNINYVATSHSNILPARQQQSIDDTENEQGLWQELWNTPH